MTHTRSSSVHLKTLDSLKYFLMSVKENEKPDDSKILGDLYEIYYRNRDLKLFLELLAMGSGVAPSIAVMTLFDSVSILYHFMFYHA